MPTFTLPIPPSSNTMFTPGVTFGGRRVRRKSDEYLAWLDHPDVVEAIRWEPPPGPLSVKIRVTMPPGLRRDLDNNIKTCLDAAVGKGHDHRVYEIHVRRELKRIAPGWIEVTVEPIGTATAGGE